MDSERDEDQNGFSPPSIFSALWFRALLGVIVLVLIALIAVPYFLDWFSRSPSGPVVVLKREPAPPLRLSPTGAASPASPTLTTPTQVEKPPSQAGATPVEAKPVGKAMKPAPELSAKRVEEDDEAAPPSARGGYTVQVGAFRDADNAARLAAQLAREKYPLQRAVVPRPRAGGGRHEVVIVGASVEEVNGKLQGTTHTAVATREGVVIHPALPLKDAVALSQELRADGLTAKIRRAQEVAALHVVRVGAYPNRSRAEAVRKELEGKGFSGFIVHEARR